MYMKAFMSTTATQATYKRDNLSIYLGLSKNYYKTLSIPKI